MKTRFIILACIIFTLQTAIAQTNEIEKKANNSLTNLRQSQKVIGASAGYSKDGKIIWQYSIGFSDNDNKQKFNIETTVRIASISKPMTAVAVMQLLEQGLIKLDEPIDTYIPSFPQKGKSKITIRHLLSHTSGIDGYKNGKEAETKTNYATLSEAVDVFKGRKLLFEPGTKYHYTTYGYVVLGLIIERVSGLTFEKYMQKNIWDKAEMTNTGVDKFKIKINGSSEIYITTKRGKLKRGEENNLSNRIPGGGFYSNLEDLLKFGNALLTNKLISNKSFELMTQHHSLEKVNNAYGFGWFLYGKKPNEGEIIGHSGEQTGASAFLFIIPQNKTVVVCLSNTSGALNAVGGVCNELMRLSMQK